MSAKRKKANKESIKEKDQTGKHEFDALRQVAFWGLALLLFFPPYFRGLFFAPQQEKALVFAALVFWLTFLWRWLQNDHKFLRGPLDWLALALPVVYIICSFTAVNKGLAIDEVVKNILYFLTYWSVSRLIRNEEDIHKLLHVVYISAVGVALAGLATATEVINIKDGFNVTQFGGTISSTLQYHNALGAYLGAVFFIGLYLWNLSNQKQHDIIIKTAANQARDIQTRFLSINLPGYLYACGNFLLLAVLLGSKSRGGLLAFGVVFIVYLIGMGNKQRLTALLTAGCLGLVSYFTINKFITLVQDKHYDPAWAWMITGICAAVIYQVIFNSLNRRILTGWAKNDKRYILIFASIIVAAGVVGGIWLSGKPRLIEKATSFEYLWTAYQRFHYADSALQMIQDRPLLGWGGGGWSEAYESYLGFRYTTRQAHSYYLQTGVETGIPGVLIVAGIWLSFLLTLYKQYRGNPDNILRRQIIWLLASVFLMISAHALIDFDLSLSALTLVLWSLFGIASAHPVPVATKKRPAGLEYTSIAIVTAMALFIIVSSTYLARADSFYNRAAAYFNAGNIAEGTKYLEKAAAYNPFNSTYRISLSQAYIKQGINNKALEEAESAVRLSKFNFLPKNNLVQIAILANNNKLAAKELEGIIMLAPNNIETYEQYANNYFNMGLKELSKGNNDNAGLYLNKSIDVNRLLTKQAASISVSDKEMWDGPPLQLSDNLKLILGRAAYCLGHFSDAQSYLQQAAQSNDNSIKAQALLWQALLHEKSGNLQESKNLLNRVNQLDQTLYNSYTALKSIPVLK
ncbi:O-antigen ligase family protein [Desulfotruncus alcoholivorax]|uniref:O-antigen ligase family protein n=1 Tax=Desulfotruncus alcoholivorax TaxID=265477 RepID=UPI0004193D7B|nr:O-antigen ligase family protein [Desulfotruncus alcoholivorax]